jgi:GNAT superfamily N-acetyltransferase
MPRTAELTYTEYPYINGDRRDTKLNKEIISLARRNKFYLKNIQGLFKSSNSISRHFGGGSNEIYIARKGVKLVGFIVFNGNTLWGGEPMIMDLQYWLVDEDHRGVGVGKALYSKMEERAKAYGLDNYSVMYKKDDDVLKQLYENKGYKFIPKYDGRDTQESCRGDKHIKLYIIKYTCYRMPGDKVGEKPSLILIETEVKPVIADEKPVEILRDCKEQLERVFGDDLENQQKKGAKEKP